MKVTLDLSFDIGEAVYLKTDIDQFPRFVVGITIKPNRVVVYDLQSGDKAITSHYAFEISSEKDVLMTSTN